MWNSRKREVASWFRKRPFQQVGESFPFYNVGTTIMTCNPLSFAVTNDKQAFVCQNCLKEYPKLMACGKCGYAHYCCRECQVQDWFGRIAGLIPRKRHKKECGWMKKLMEVGDGGGR